MQILATYDICPNHVAWKQTGWYQLIVTKSCQFSLGCVLMDQVKLYGWSDKVLTTGIHEKTIQLKLLTKNYNFD